MFCPKCGKRNDEDAKYCAYCGGEIVDTQPEEVSPGQFLRNRLEVFFRGDARKGGAAAKSFLMRHRKALPLGGGSAVWAGPLPARRRTCCPFSIMAGTSKKR